MPTIQQLVRKGRNVLAVQTVINDFKREKREEKKAAQDDEYHVKRMEALK